MLTGRNIAHDRKHLSSRLGPPQGRGGPGHMSQAFRITEQRNDAAAQIHVAEIFLLHQNGRPGLG